MKTYELKLTRAMVIQGGVVRAGTKVSLDEPTAKDFLRRGKAELISAPANDDRDDCDQGVDLSRLNKTQLVDLAGQLGIEGAGDLTKAQLVAAIEAAGADQAA